jgi:hypothetical protein
MKRLITCAGLAAVGATSLQAQFLGDSAPQKPWSVSAKLRGFYDDNYLTAASQKNQLGQEKRGSWGAQLTPSVSYNNQWDVTSVGARFEYGATYFEDRPRGAVDSSYMGTLSAGHSFGERLKVDVSDSFVAAQEPFLIEPDPVFTAFRRTKGDNIRNTGSFTATGSITQKLGAQLRYINTIKDYSESGGGSRSALLDSTEQTAALDLRYNLSPSAVAVVGYQFGRLKMTGGDFVFNPQFLFDQFTAINGAAPTPAQQANLTASIPKSNNRNSRSQSLYAGVDYNFTAKIAGKLRGGAQYTEYTDPSPGVTKPDNWVPYAEAELGAQYGTGSSARIGVRHSRNQTDVALLLPSIVVKNQTPTLDQESTTLYGSVNQKIGPKLTAIVRAQWQNSKFNGGQADNQYDNYYGGDAQLVYQLPKIWKFMDLFAEAGYSFDRVDSDLVELGASRSFTRNRIYLGLRATL